MANDEESSRIINRNWRVVRKLGQGGMGTVWEVRDRLAATLPDFELTLCRGDEIVDRGRGRHALDSPALALQHLARVVASQPEAPPLRAGEMVTTGTLTDAWQIAAGSRWRSDYGTLGVPGIELAIE